ncbi:hypothetical protein Trydic_g21531 [Trypoxylus dichotomus]
MKSGTIILTILLFACLYPNLNCSTDFRIVGGRPAIEGEIPYQVSIRRSYNDEHFCGGTLVTAKHVLLAAHCMYYTWGGLLPPIVVSVVAGQLTLPITGKSVYRNASMITVHSGFNKNTMANDIAVIEVDEAFPIDTNPLISPVPLRNDSVDNGSCFVSGWGIEEYGTNIISQTLLVTEVHIVEFSKCRSMYSPNVTLSDGMLCAGHENGTTDACKGDSGGPLVCDGLLTGIVSTGTGCGNAKYPGIYTEIAYFLPWIQSVIQVDTPSIHDNDSDLDNTSQNEFLTIKVLDKSNGMMNKFNVAISGILILLNLLYI